MLSNACINVAKRGRIECVMQVVQLVAKSEDKNLLIKWYSSIVPLTNQCPLLLAEVQWYAGSAFSTLENLS